MPRTATLALNVLICLAGATTAHAEIIRIDLPQLLGAYQTDPTQPARFQPADRSAQIPNTVPASWQGPIELVLRGTLSPGLLRGDGVIVLAGDRFLQGAIQTGLSTGRATSFTLDFSAVPGSFELHRTLSVYDPGPVEMPIYPPQPFAPLVLVSLRPDYSASAWPARLIPPTPDGPLDGLPGYTTLTPVTAQITEAYVLVTGTGVPEPATLGALLLSGLALLRRRR